MANVYAIRVHEVDESTRQKMVEFCEKLDGSYVIVKETDAARVHFQGWIRSDIKDQALRKRLKIAFPEAVGNKGYSLTRVKDFDRYHMYVLKGTKESRPHVVCSCGIELTPEDLEEIWIRYWKTHEKPKASNRSITDEILEWAKTQTWPNTDARLAAIVEFYKEAMLAKKKGLDDYQAKRTIQGIMCALDDEYSKYWSRKIISSIY